MRFTIAPGQKLAVVGASGAGKTTLTKLLLRFYDPDRGRITLDGVDLRELSLADLRRNLAAVLQETLVFDGTVARQHPLGTARGARARRRRGGDRRGRARASSPPCPTATTPASGSAAGCCRAASGSGWRSPGR